MREGSRAYSGIPKALARFAATALVLGCSPAEIQNQPPSIEISTTLGGQAHVLGLPLGISVVATDPDGTVERIWLDVDGKLIGEADSPSHNWTWTPDSSTPKFPVIRAVARDDQGATAVGTLLIETRWAYVQPEEVEDGWESSGVHSVGMSPAPFEDLMDHLRSDPDHLIHSILVARFGKLVFEAYFPGLSHPTYGETPVAFDRETPHCLSSVTKSITSTLLGVAIGKGLISGLDESVLGFFPYLADLEATDRKHITLEHLVTMTTGLEWDEWTFPFADPRNDLGRFIQLAPASDKAAVRFVLEKPIVAPPGTRLIYNGGNSNVLGKVIQVASGMRLDEFSAEHLFAPLGITDASWWLFSPTFVYASGDITLRPRDVLKFGQLYLQEGTWEGQTVVPREWVEASSSPAWTFPHRDPLNDNVGYGYGWWIKGDSYGLNAYNASGWGGQDIVVMPEWDLVVVVTAGGYWQQPKYSAHQIIQNFVIPAFH